MDLERIQPANDKVIKEAERLSRLSQASDAPSRLAKQESIKAAAAMLNLETEESGKDFNEHTNLDQYIGKHTSENVVKLHKKVNDKQQINRSNFLQSSFYK